MPPSYTYTRFTLDKTNKKWVGLLQLVDVLCGGGEQETHKTFISHGKVNRVIKLASFDCVIN